MRIADFEIGKGRTFVIAEIGGNHEGDFGLAKRMVEEAAHSGADAVKFQILRAERTVSSASGQLAYSGISHREQFERFRKREFNKKQYRELASLARRSGIIFLASVFDPELADEIDDLMPTYKVASGDLAYYTLLKHLRKKRKPILLSTGASTLAEIKRTICWIGKKDLVVLHCVSSYPAPYEEMNLLSIPFLHSKLKVPVGFSDHSVGIECALAAVALGACAIEKHFTLDKTISYGDHKLSVNPEELRQMVDSIRIIEKARGLYGRPLLPCEQRARGLVRRSLFAAKDLSKNHAISGNDLVALRPLEGIPAELEQQVLGRKLKRSISKGAPLMPADLTHRSHNNNLLLNPLDPTIAPFRPYGKMRFK